MTNYNLHRQILSQSDLSDFLSSQSFADIESFLLDLNDSVKGLERKDTVSKSSQLIDWAVGLLKAAEDLIQEFPPQNRNADVNRFGNIAFREWIFALQERIVPKLMKSAPVSTASSELEGYFINSLGSSQRIDYGTGHELHFLVFLLGLRAEKEEYPALVLTVFSAYLRLMRRLQKTYWLEPAGSHGVWGLDDYHFLPFLFGSAQLCDHPNIRPRAVHSPEMVHYLAPKYIYFDSILNILEIKTATLPQDHSNSELHRCLSEAPRTNALRWMSPVLDDISAVKTWDKVNGGLIKMWRVEVMSKLPIMQHLLFGEEILNFKRNEQKDQTEEESADPATVHYTHSLRGDCCGNPLPSIYAATNNNESKSKQPGLPFD